LAAFGAACGYTSMMTSPAVVSSRTVVTCVNAGAVVSLPGKGVSFASCRAAGVGFVAGVLAPSSVLG